MTVLMRYKTPETNMLLKSGEHQFSNRKMMEAFIKLVNNTNRLYEMKVEIEIVLMPWQKIWLQDAYDQAGDTREKHFIHSVLEGKWLPDLFKPPKSLLERMDLMLFKTSERDLSDDTKRT